MQGDEYPGIYLVNADGSGEEKIAENVFPSSASGTTLAWGPDGRKLFYTKIEIVRNTGNYNDLYTYDLASRREVRLTKGLRARDPHPSPDGTMLLFVMNRMGMTRLAALDLAKERSMPVTEKDITPLTPWGAEQFETPRISPDGSRIAVGLGQPGGCRDIRLRLLSIAHCRLWIISRGQRLMRSRFPRSGPLHSACFPPTGAAHSTGPFSTETRR